MRHPFRALLHFCLRDLAKLFPKNNFNFLRIKNHFFSVREYKKKWFEVVEKKLKCIAILHRSSLFMCFQKDTFSTFQVFVSSRSTECGPQSSPIPVCERGREASVEVHWYIQQCPWTHDGDRTAVGQSQVIQGSWSRGLFRHPRSPEKEYWHLCVQGSQWRRKSDGRDTVIRPVLDKKFSTFIL